MVQHPVMAKDNMALRIEPVDLERVLAVKAKMTGGGIEPSRSDVLRMLVLRGLESAEPEYGIAPPVDMRDPMRGPSDAPKKADAAKKRRAAREGIAGEAHAFIAKAAEEVTT